jgi:hypothetical protein
MRNLARRLKEGALANTQRDLQLTAEWLAVEEDARQRCAKPNQIRSVDLEARGRNSEPRA